MKQSFETQSLPRRRFIAGALQAGAAVGLAPFLSSCTLRPSAGRRPNILLVMVDDMGYSDIGCYGGEIRTPTIDRLAAEGVRYSRFYNAAQCCPSRAALMSGLYPHQAGMGDMNARGPTEPFWKLIGSPSYLGFKKEGIIALPEALHEGGYQTFMAGKWHLGDTSDNWPVARGFDRSFALLEGACEQFTGYGAWKNKGPILPFVLDAKRLETLPEHFYTTDSFTDYAMRFIEGSKPGRPWFTYLAFTAPHWPFQAHAPDIEKYRDVYRDGPEAIRKRRAERLREMGLLPEGAPLPELDPTVTEEAKTMKADEWELWMRTYAAMIDRVDQNIERVVQLLKSRGEFDNTMIIFLSDNGADTVRGPLWGQVSNTPFRRFKCSVHDGGIATPLIIHWPAGIPESQRGKILGGYGHIIDIQPTCLAAAGVTQPKTFRGVPVVELEGTTLLPSASGKVSLPGDRLLFWERMGNQAVRRGDWKLVRTYGKMSGRSGEVKSGGPRTGEWELYNLALDPGETDNLVEKHPEIVAELLPAFEAWAKRVGVVPREIIVEKAGLMSREE